MCSPSAKSDSCLTGFDWPSPARRHNDALRGHFADEDITTCFPAGSCSGENGPQPTSQDSYRPTASTLNIAKRKRFEDLTDTETAPKNYGKSRDGMRDTLSDRSFSSGGSTSGSESNDGSDVESEPSDYSSTDSEEILKLDKLDKELYDSREELLRRVFQHFLEWARNSKSMLQVEEDLPPLMKRLRTGTKHTRVSTPGDREHASSSGSDLPKVHELGLLACPFFARNPGQYRGCLFRDDLRSLNNVVDHLQRHHGKPFYCPVCYRTFSRNKDMHEHVNARMCQIVDVRTVEGLNDYQKDKILRDDDPMLNDLVRWQQIWKTAFPNDKSCKRPELGQGTIQTVMMLTEYWEEAGRGYIHRWIRSRCDSRSAVMKTEAAWNTMRVIILTSLLSQAVQERTKRVGLCRAA